MTVTASELRKNLFGLLEKAVHDEDVQVTYQGVTFQLIPKGRIVSKLSRVQKRDILNVPPGDLISNEDSLRDMESEWDRESREMVANAGPATENRSLRPQRSQR